MLDSDLMDGEFYYGELYLWARPPNNGNHCPDNPEADFDIKKLKWLKDIWHHYWDDLPTEDALPMETK